MKHLTVKDFAVGQEVVLMEKVGENYHPIRHNSKNNPAHPCRGTVTKVGRKLVSITTTGADWKIDTQSYRTIFPVDQAKSLYRKTLEAYKSKDTDHLVDQL